jgi:hypothetical protein
MTTSPATWADVEALPDDVVGEIIPAGGRLYVSSRLPPTHARVQQQILTDLQQAFGDWWLLADPRLYLHGAVLVPAIAGWRKDRLPDPPRGPRIELPPDWVCQIIKPEGRGFERTSKLTIYHRARVPIIWILKLECQLIEVCEHDPKGWLWAQALDCSRTESARLQPFEALEVDLSRWSLPE